MPVDILMLRIAATASIPMSNPIDERTIPAMANALFSLFLPIMDITSPGIPIGNLMSGMSSAIIPMTNHAIPAQFFVLSPRTTGVCVAP